MGAKPPLEISSSSIVTRVHVYTVNAVFLQISVKSEN